MSGDDFMPDLLEQDAVISVFSPEDEKARTEFVEEVNKRLMTLSNRFRLSLRVLKTQIESTDILEKKERFAGSDGYSTLYKAKIRSGGRFGECPPIVLKEIATSSNKLEVFDCIAKSLLAIMLGHPNLPRPFLVNLSGSEQSLLTFFDRTTKSFMLALEKIDGKTFTLTTDDSRALSPEQRTRIICEIIDTMYFLECLGLFHGDLKEDNVMIRTSCYTPVVIDMETLGIEPKKLANDITNFYDMAGDLLGNFDEEEEKEEVPKCLHFLMYKGSKPEKRLREWASIRNRIGEFSSGQIAQIRASDPGTGEQIILGVTPLGPLTHLGIFTIPIKAIEAGPPQSLFQREYKEIYKARDDRIRRWFDKKLPKGESSTANAGAGQRG